MNILFVHQNFPGQFKHLAPALAADPANTVVALTMKPVAPTPWRGIRIIPYQVARGSTPNIHPWVSGIETKVNWGEAAYRAALGLKREGFSPELIVAHPGWGESLFLKEVWPTAKLGIYCEFFHHARGASIGFDPEFPTDDPDIACRTRMRNANLLMHFDLADAGWSPTHWQAGRFPELFRAKITVMHEGIDTDAIAPDPEVKLILDRNTVLTRQDEIITFANRNLEPYRGYHIFMRALPEILRRRPNARVLIVGGSEKGYGRQPPDGGNWRDLFAKPLRERIGSADWERVHFLGKLSHRRFVRVLQASTAHVYLTYPYVLSWGLLEAMSAGCAIVASDTAPLSEAIRHDETGLLVDFFDVEGLARAVCDLMQDPGKRTRLGANARAFAKASYDLETVCLPMQLEWINRLAGREP